MRVTPMKRMLLVCVFLYVLSLMLAMERLALSPLGYVGLLSDGAYYYIVQHGYNTLSPPSTELFPWPPLLFIVAAIPAWVLGLSTLQTLQFVYPALLSLMPVVVYLAGRQYGDMAILGGVYAAMSPAQLLSMGYTYYKFAFAEILLVVLIIALFRIERGGGVFNLGAACFIELALAFTHPAIAGVGMLLLAIAIIQARGMLRPWQMGMLAAILVCVVVGMLMMYPSSIHAAIGQPGYFVSPAKLMSTHPAVALGLVLGIWGAVVALRGGGVQRAVALFALLLLMNSVAGIVFYYRYFVLADLLLAILLPLGMAAILRFGAPHATTVGGALVLLLLLSLPTTLAANGEYAPSCSEVGAYAMLHGLHGMVLTDELHAPWACALSGMDCPMLPFDERRESALTAYYQRSTPSGASPVYVVIEHGSAFNGTKLLDTGELVVLRVR